MNIHTLGKRIVPLAILITVFIFLWSQPGEASLLSGLADTPWPMFQHDNQHTGRSPYLGISNAPVKLWETTLYEGTAYADNTGLSIGNDSTIYISGAGTRAIDPKTGNILWSYPASGRDSPTIASDGTMYFQYENTFYALYPNGISPWAFGPMSSNVAFHSSPAIDENGKLYIDHDALWSFFPYPQGDPPSPLDWFIPAGTFSHTSPAIGHDGTIYFINSSDLVAMKPDTEVLWRRNLPNITGSTPYISDDPANPEDGTILLAGVGDAYGEYLIHAVGLDGTVKWTYDIGSKGPMANIAIAQDGTIYITHRRGFDALNPDGSSKYTKTDLGRIAVDRLGQVFLCDSSCMGFDADGSLLWKTTEKTIFDSPATSYSVPVIAADGLMYVTTGQNPCFHRDPHCPGIFRIAAYADPSLYPVISSSESTFHYQIQAGESLPSQTIHLTSTLHPVAWKAALLSDEPGWVSLSPENGVTPGDVEMHFQTEGLTAGSHEATLSIAPVDEIGGWMDIPVVVDVAGIDLNPYHTFFPIIAFDGIFSDNSRPPNYALASSDYNGAQSFLRLWNPDGSISLMSYNGGSRISWSPDGEKFARVNGMTHQLFTMTPDGKDYEEITKFDDYSKDYPVWSPDGQKIAFLGSEETYEDHYRNLRVINIDGSDMRVLTAALDIQSIAWSPDSQKISYTVKTPGGSRAHVINVDGSHDILLGDTIYSWEAGGWSPDGKKILLQKHAGWDDIYVVNPDGSGLTNLTNHAGWSLIPSWSPDGSQIVFARRLPPVDYLSEVYIMNADGSGQTQITSLKTQLIEIAFSPDAKHLAFSSTSGLRVMDLNTRQIIRSRPYYHQENLSWRPAPNP